MPSQHLTNLRCARQSLACCRDLIQRCRLRGEARQLASGCSDMSSCSHGMRAAGPPVLTIASRGPGCIHSALALCVVSLPKTKTLKATCSL